jgi:colanic acid/amylovoran biosynthesis glycosyltransferase
MKIAMVVPVFPKLSETFIVGKFLGLLRRGYDVQVICQMFDAAALAYFPGLAACDDLPRRVVVRRPTEPRWRAALAAPATLAKTLAADWRMSLRYLASGWRKFGLDLPREFYLDAELIACRRDIVHFEFGALARGRVEQVGWLGAKSVVSFRGHDLLFVGLEDKKFYADAWEQADALHFLGNALWNAARRRGLPDSKPHRLIAPAIDPDFFNPAVRENRGILGTKQRPIRLASAGRLDWSKGYEYALQAVERLRGRGVNVEYRVVGDGAQREALLAVLCRSRRRCAGAGMRGADRRRPVGRRHGRCRGGHGPSRAGRC